jgi:hypothetical protein
MARVTYGSLVTALAGSIGGTTFQLNNSGNIARSKAHTSTTNSNFQSSHQNLLVQLVAKWPTLTSAYKAQWNALAASGARTNVWGESKVITGYQYFIAYNLYYYTVHSSFVSIHATKIIPPSISQFTLSATPTTFDLVWTVPPPLHSGIILIYATPPLRQNNIKLRRAVFFLKQQGAFSTTSISILSEYVTEFNLDWNELVTSGNCCIIVRVLQIGFSNGYVSPYTSALIQIN